MFRKKIVDPWLITHYLFQTFVLTLFYIYNLLTNDWRYFLYALVPMGIMTGQVCLFGTGWDDDCEEI